MPSPEGFRPKLPEQLSKQFHDAQSALSDAPEHSFIPPSADEEEFMNMSLSEIKEKYARRYEMYLRTVREQKPLEGLSEEEVGFFMPPLDDIKKWIRALNCLDVYIQEHREGVERTLRERQLTVFEDLRNFVEAGGREGYVKLPTGVGKTVLFTEFVEALNLKTLIVVPKKLLVHQTEGKFKKFAPDLDVGKVYDNAKQFGRQVTIITYNSLRIQLEKGTIKPEDYDCLILDEVHASLSDERMKIVKQFDKSLNIGFTATPDYSDEKGVNQLLATEIHSMSIKEAVHEKLLSPFTSILARTKVDISNVKITSTGEYSESELEEAVNVVGRNKAAVDLYKQGFNGELAVAYCAGIQHAKDVAKLFNEEGVPAAVISGKTPPKEQEKLIEQFHNGEVKVLCNSDILIEGFDEQRAKVCLNLKPTRSRIVAEQRGGRVLRLDDDNPQKHAYIIDFIDHRVPETNLPILFANVAGDAQILPRGAESWGTGGGGGRPPDDTPQVPDIYVEGLEVITETEEIMKVMSKYEEKEKVEKVSLDDLKKEVRALGINRAKDYFKIVRSKPSWPSKPHIFYKSQGWISWPNLFGTDVERKGKAEKLTLDGLKAEVHALKIKNRESYHLTAQTKPSWPASPDKFYKDSGWVSWVDFLPPFTEDEATKKLNLSQLKAEVLSLGINSQREYRIIVKTKPKWPSNPHQTFKGKGWISWEDLCGKEKLPQKEKAEKLSLEQLRLEVKALGIKNLLQYRSVSKDHPTWPFHPDRFYKGKGWVNWENLLGK